MQMTGRRIRIKGRIRRRKRGGERER